MTGRDRRAVFRATTVLAVVPGVIALAIALFGPFFAPHDIAQPIGLPWNAPGSSAPLGTDFLGRDVLSRVLNGGRTVVLLPLVATAISVTLGAVIGILAGSIHNWIDGLLMRSMDLILVMPAILILLVLVTGFGGGPGVLVAVVVLVTGPFTARLARSLAIDISRTGYVESAIGRGEGMTAVLFREVMPNVAGPILAEAGLVFTSAIFVVAFANYLGFGVQPPAADWALMAAENNPGIDFNVWSVLVPVLLIVSLTISVNLFADRLAQHLAGDDPQDGCPMSAFLEVEGLSIVTAAHGVPVVDDLRWTLEQGQTLGVVGESGSGKTTTALALLGVVRRGLVVARGSVTVAGEKMLGRDDRDLRKIRGRIIAYLGQNPASSLTPTMRVGRQVAETLRLGPDGRESVGRLLESFGLPGDRAFQQRYPHQISGGQQQRVALARAFASRPRIVVLDEPTTGLDAATQDLVLTEIERLRSELSLSVFMVSHDLAVVARLADRILVMRRGEVVEHGDLGKVLSNARHEHTRTLIAARLDHRTIPAREPTRGPLPRAVLRVEHLSASYRAARTVVAVEDVSFSVHPGRCVALVGSSGAGKTTIARSVVGLHRPDGGCVYVNDVPQAPAVRDRSPTERRRVQLIHQDSSSSLNPRHTVGKAIARPLRLRRGISARAARAEVGLLLERVRLPQSVADRLPSQLSGGERQRIAIARALAAEPEVLVCDEITSSLDTSIQATILDLVTELQRDLGIGVLLVTHDRGVVARVADHVVVLDHGRVCEEGPVTEVLSTRGQGSTTPVLASSQAPPPTAASAREPNEAS